MGLGCLEMASSRMSQTGQEGRSPVPRTSGCCPLGEPTFAEVRGNGRDAPITAIGQNKLGAVKSTLNGHRLPHSITSSARAEPDQVVRRLNLMNDKIRTKVAGVTTEFLLQRPGEETAYGVRLPTGRGDDLGDPASASNRGSDSPSMLEFA